MARAAARRRLAPVRRRVGHGDAQRRFDVMSHPDLAKIFGVRGGDGEYATMAAAADESGVALEVSTAGLRKPVGELYPDERLLRGVCRARR